MLKWPDIFPKPQRSDYQIESQDVCVRTDFEVGPERVRRRYTAMKTYYALTWNMNSNQFAVFEQWFWSPDYCNAGAEWFEIDLASGSGFLTHVARFIDKFSAQSSAPHRWIVSAPVLVEEPQRITSDEVEAMIDELSVSEFDQVDDIIDTLDDAMGDLQL